MLQAQDAHTKNEQAVYITLWRIAETALARQGRTPLDPRNRIVSVGDITLATAASVAPMTVRKALTALRDKLALDIRPPKEPGMAKIFVVYSYAEILSRRRTAGLTHYVRRYGAIDLVNPTTVLLPPVGSSASGTLHPAPLNPGTLQGLDLQSEPLEVQPRENP